MKIVHGVMSIPIKMEIDTNNEDDAFKAAESILNNHSIAEMYINILTIEDNTLDIQCDGWDVEWWL